MKRSRLERLGGGELGWLVCGRSQRLAPIIEVQKPIRGQPVMVPAPSLWYWTPQGVAGALDLDPPALQPARIACSVHGSHLVDAARVRAALDSGRRRIDVCDVPPPL
jgi:hypothetical protein